MNKIIFFFFVFIFILSGCKDNNPVNPPCGGVAPGIVFSPPYNSPIWHPSGKFIGFNHTLLVSISYTQGEGCIGEQHFNRDSTGFWLINPDGSNMHRIFPYTLQTPSWSPDGKWVAFVVGAQIYKMKFTGTTFDTTTIVQLTFEGRNFFPAWSPDGKWIAYDSNIESPNGMSFIWMMNSDGNNKIRIAYEPKKGEIREPSWSPNGHKIVHIRYSKDFNTYASEIFVMDKNGNNVKRLTYNDDMESNPKYSPDGSKIAFWSNDNIWIMDSTGGNLRQLTTQGVDVDFGLSFSWSPDGSSIVYTDYRPNDWNYNNGTLWMLNPNTGEKKQLTFNIKPK